MLKKKLKSIPAEEFRKPMTVTHYSPIITPERLYRKPVCPRCGCIIMETYQSYCAACGQRLKWNYSRIKNGSKNTHYTVRNIDNMLLSIGTYKQCLKDVSNFEDSFMGYTIEKI